MRNIYRFIVNNYGEEETIKVNGEIVFINSPFKRSLKIFSFPKWRFRKKKYAKKLKQYNVTCIDWIDYSLENILFYLLLKSIEKYDCICFGFAGFDYSTIEKTKRFLLELEPHIDGKLVLIVVEKVSVDEKGIISGFPIYNGNG
jgi:hypothetical protein